MATVDKTVEQLENMIAKLRDPVAGCSWSKEQTLESLTKYTIEESHELKAAITDNDNEHIKEEVGDLFLQVLFYAQIAKEEKRFTLEDVTNALAKKLEIRNPHVFSDAILSDVDAVKKNWNETKAKEREARGQTGTLDDIPSSLPAVLRSRKIQSRVADMHFDWPTLKGVMGALKEEVDELDYEITHNATKERMIEEFGDVLFTCVNLARHLDTTVEHALNRSNEKFIKRFDAVEKMIQKEEKKFEDLSFDELLWYWNTVKDKEK